MPFQKGNKLGGRKGFGQEVEAVKEDIKRMTIEELATDIVYKSIKTINPTSDKKDVKDLAMPVYLKSKADKQNIQESVTIKVINYNEDGDNTTI